ncbi:MAG: C40 family peptidase [Planctomycetes bacterium]|nr:C40 family peptidase [Planctomycetota bacterium]
MELPDLIDGRDNLDVWQRNQARWASLFAPVSEAQPGDVLLYGRNGAVRHMAVVLEGNRAIHAGVRLGVAIQRLRPLLKVGARIMRFRG